MKTLIITKHRADENTSYAFQDGNCIASLNHNTDKLLEHCTLTEDEKDSAYAEMVDNRPGVDNYDVRAEQGLYTYGY